MSHCSSCRETSYKREPQKQIFFRFDRTRYEKTQYCVEQLVVFNYMNPILIEYCLMRTICVFHLWLTLCFPSGLSLLCLPQRLHAAHPHGARKQVFLQRVSYLPREVRMALVFFLSLREYKRFFYVLYICGRIQLLYRITVVSGFDSKLKTHCNFSLLLMCVFVCVASCCICQVWFLQIYEDGWGRRWQTVLLPQSRW